jgi:molybdopterin synthase catalytic subunit
VGGERQGAASSPTIDGWVSEVKAQVDPAATGMVLVHQGVVRGTSKTGEQVAAMVLGVDRRRLDELLAEARGWPGVQAVRVWVNEGTLAVGDDIMKVLVAGDSGDRVHAAMQRLVAAIKGAVVSETELGVKGPRQT